MVPILTEDCADWANIMISSTGCCVLGGDQLNNNGISYAPGHCHYPNSQHLTDLDSLEHPACATNTTCAQGFRPSIEKHQ